MYNFFIHKSDTIPMVMEFSPPNVTLIPELLGLGLATWNALLE
jgi:hypothetical protein